ncbi:hypothetical protein OAL35_01695 [bacterium]|nr:hypothetical protein [bacterium]
MLEASFLSGPRKFFPKPPKNHLEHLQSSFPRGVDVRFGVDGWQMEGFLSGDPVSKECRWHPRRSDEIAFSANCPTVPLTRERLVM